MLQKILLSLALLAPFYGVNASEVGTYSILEYCWNHYAQVDNRPAFNDLKSVTISFGSYEQRISKENLAFRFQQNFVLNTCLFDEGDAQKCLAKLRYSQEQHSLAGKITHINNRILRGNNVKKGTWSLQSVRACYESLKYESLEESKAKTQTFGIRVGGG